MKSDLSNLLNKIVDLVEGVQLEVSLVGELLLDAMHLLGHLRVLKVGVLPSPLTIL